MLRETFILKILSRNFSLCVTFVKYTIITIALWSIILDTIYYKITLRKSSDRRALSSPFALSHIRFARHKSIWIKPQSAFKINRKKLRRTHPEHLTIGFVARRDVIGASGRLRRSHGWLGKFRRSRNASAKMEIHVKICAQIIRAYSLGYRRNYSPTRLPDSERSSVGWTTIRENGRAFVHYAIPGPLHFVFAVKAKPFGRLRWLSTWSETARTDAIF